MNYVLLALALLLISFASHVRAESTRATLKWEAYDKKDPLTDAVTHGIASDTTFPDGTRLQSITTCVDNGLNVLLRTLRGDSLNLFASASGKINVPVFVDGRSHTAHIETKNPRANQIVILFYDQATAKRTFDRRVKETTPGLFQLTEGLKAINKIRIEALWENFIGDTGGTLSQFVNARSARIQLSLADGTSNVAEITPQDDPVMKDFAQRCNSQFRESGKKAADQEREADEKEKARVKAEQVKKDAECARYKAEYSAESNCAKACQQLTPFNSPKITPATAQCFNGCPKRTAIAPDWCQIH
jgi:hypothetical protein